MINYKCRPKEKQVPLALSCILLRYFDVTTLCLSRTALFETENTGVSYLQRLSAICCHNWARCVVFFLDLNKSTARISLHRKMSCFSFHSITVFLCYELKNTTRVNTSQSLYYCCVRELLEIWYLQRICSSRFIKNLKDGVLTSVLCKTNAMTCAVGRKQITFISGCRPWPKNVSCLRSLLTEKGVHFRWVQRWHESQKIALWLLWTE